MKKSYDRTTSVQVAVRFANDIHHAISKHGRKGSFSSRLFALVRDYARLKRENRDMKGLLKIIIAAESPDDSKTKWHTEARRLLRSRRA